MKFCDGESACQGTRDCQSGQTCQEMENQAFCNDRDSTDLEYTASPKFNGQRFDIYSKFFSDNFFFKNYSVTIISFSIIQLYF